MLNLLAFYHEKKQKNRPKIVRRIKHDSRRLRRWHQSKEILYRNRVRSLMLSREFLDEYLTIKRINESIKVEHFCTYTLYNRCKLILLTMKSVSDTECSGW